MPTVQDIAERYVALWNEIDPLKRRQAIEAFFAPHAEHYVNQRMAIGYDALFERVTGSHDKNVRDAGNAFRAAPGAQRLRNVAIFDWEMTPPGDPGTVSAVGRQVIVLDDADRAVRDYQFIVA